MAKYNRVERTAIPIVPSVSIKSEKISLNLTIVIISKKENQIWSNINKFKHKNDQNLRILKYDKKPY